MAFIYLAVVITFMISNSGKNIASPTLIIILLPAFIFYACCAWRHFATRHERRAERRIDRKRKEARRAIAWRGGYVDQMFIASKSGNISVADLISETDDAWVLKLVAVKLEVRISKNDCQQRAFSARSDAMKWAGVEQGRVELFVATGAQNV
jgi:hypothetical protein